MIKMKKENNEMMDLLKELVSRIKQIEQTVYSGDNLLMKSGIVKVESPTPSITKHDTVPDSDTIANMSWDDINNLVGQLGGE